MARKVADCRRFPSESQCTLTDHRRGGRGPARRRRAQRLGARPRGHARAAHADRRDARTRRPGGAPSRRARPRRSAAVELGLAAAPAGRPPALAILDSCPSSPRSRRSAASSRRWSRGARCALEISTPAGAAAGAGRARRRAHRSPGRAPGPAASTCSGVRGRHLAGHAPAHDRGRALRRTRRGRPTAGSDDARRRAHADFCDPRRFGTGELAVGEPALQAFLDARLGVEPLGPRLHHRAAAHPRARHARAGQGVPARPAPRRRGREHLRRRGAVPRPHPSAPPGGAAARAQLEALRDAVRACSRPGSTPGGSRSTTSVTPTASRILPGRVPGPPPPRGGLPALRRADPQARGGRPRHHRMWCSLPARAAASLTPR